MSHFVTDILLVILGLVASVIIVLSIVGIGWFLVWKFFLSRFKFVRELLGTVSEPNSEAPNAGAISSPTRIKSRKSRLD